MQSLTRLGYATIPRAGGWVIVGGESAVHYDPVTQRWHTENERARGCGLRTLRAHLLARK